MYAEKVTLENLMDCIVDSTDINMDMYNNIKHDLEEGNANDWTDFMAATHNYPLINMFANYIAGYDPDITESETGDDYFGQGYHNTVYMIECEEINQVYYDFDYEERVNALINLGYDCVVYKADVWDDFDLSYDEDTLDDLFWELVDFFHA